MKKIKAIGKAIKEYLDAVYVSTLVIMYDAIFLPSDEYYRNKDR